MNLYEQNITIVYKDLNLASISRDRIRNIMGDSVTIFDPPEMIAAIAPSEQLQFLDNRLVFIHTRPNSTVGEFDIWAKVNRLHKLTKGSTMTAYGINFKARSLPFETVEVARAHIMDSMNVDTNQVNKLLTGGNVQATYPKFVYEIEEIRCEIVIQVNTSRELEFAFNAHHASESLPAPAALKKKFLTFHTHFQSTFHNWVSK